MDVLNLSIEDFEQEVFNSQIPVFVDFWASWCGPCKMLSPIVKELAEEYDGKIKVCKVNVDEQSELAARYEIQSIPTMYIFKNGVPTEKIVGFKPKTALKSILDQQ